MIIRTLLLCFVVASGACKSRTPSSQTSGQGGAGGLAVEGEDAEEFFDVLDVQAERQLESDTGESDNVISRKQFATSNNELKIECELSAKKNSCTFTSSEPVNKINVNEGAVWELVLGGDTAQEFYNILDVPETGTESIQPPLFEKIFEGESGRFSIKCAITKDRKDCALRKAVGPGNISLLYN